MIDVWVALWLSEIYPDESAVVGVHMSRDRARKACAEQDARFFETDPPTDLAWDEVPSRFVHFQGASEAAKVPEGYYLLTRKTVKR